VAQELVIPRLGWSMEEGVFAEWLKSPGEFVRAGEMVFVLEGEKAAHEIESFDSGYLCVPADAPKPGEPVKVGQVVGFLLAEGEAAPASVGKPFSPIAPAPTAVTPQIHRPPQRPVAATTPASAMPTVPRAAGPSARRLARQLGIDLNAVYTPDPTGRVLCEDVQRSADARLRSTPQNQGVLRPIATPRARRRARELGVDWTQLVGTGRNGRICERDVLARQADAATNRYETSKGLSPTAPGRYAPASRLRQALAQRMLAGCQQAAPVTLMTKVDAAALVAYRERLKQEGAGGPIPSYNDILIFLAAQMLREAPELNAGWYREGVLRYDQVNVATAVDTESGVLAPVVREADKLTVFQIAQRTRQLIAQARSGRLTQNELEGGTFTISNLGMFGVDAFTPILNLPQAGVLGIGRIAEEPVVRSGRMEIGQTITLSLTFDHRVLDGAPAARWLQGLGQRIAAASAQSIVLAQ